MTLEFLKIVLFKNLRVLSVMIGIFLIIYTIKLITFKLYGSKFKSKYIFSLRILFGVIGLIFATNIALFRLMIISRTDLVVLLAITSLIMNIGNLVLSKKYLHN